MASVTPMTLADCTTACRPPRHLHLSPDLTALGIPCQCGQAAWAIHYGGPLPARVVCSQCLGGFNLEQLLRRTGHPAPGGPAW